MLAKVVKSDEASAFAPFPFPTIRESKFVARSVNAFVLPTLAELGSGTMPTDYRPAELPAELDLLKNARDEAARIIANAEDTSTIIDQAAIDQAIAEARHTIDAEVADRVADLRARLAETIETVSGVATEFITNAENELVELALQIAKKVVGREVTSDREIALTLVRVSLAKLHNRSVAEVHLHPEDFAFVNGQREKLDFRGTLELVEDPSISLGGCLVHTETGDIDARIDSQFDEIAHGLLN